jgi:WD40 repeat protein
MRHLTVGIDHPFPCQLAFLPGGRGLVGYVGCSLVLWDLTAETNRPVWCDESSGLLFRFAVSPCGRYVAGAADLCLVLWDLDARTAGKWLVAGNGEHVNDVAFTPDGQEVLTVLLGGGGVARRRVGNWRKKSGFGASSTTLGDRPGPFAGHLAVSPDGQALATSHHQAGDNGLSGIKLWHLPTRAHRETTTCGPESINQLVFSPDGRVLAAQHEYRRVCLWDSQALTLRAEYPPRRPARRKNKDTVRRIAFHPDGRRLAVTGSTLVTLLDVDDLRPLETFDWDIGGTFGITFHPDGTQAAVGGANGRVVVWDVD